MEAEPSSPSEALFQRGAGIYVGWRTSLASIVGLMFGPSVVLSLCYGVFAPYLRAQFGWNARQIGAGFSISEIMVTIVSIISGFVLDRFGARRLVLVCIPLFGLGFALMSRLSGTLWQFYAMLVVLPIIGVGLWPGAWVKATSGWFERRLGLAIAVATLGIGLGAVMLPVIINDLAQAQGWRTAYLVVGLGSIVVVWPLALAFVHDAPRDRAGEPLAAASASMMTLVASPILWQLGIAFAGLGVFTSAAIVNLVSVLEANGMPSRAAVLGLSALGGATMIGRLLSGWLLDRFRLNLVLPAFALAAAGAILALSFGLSGPLAYGCAACMGLMVGAEIDVLGYSIKRFFGPARYGSIFGIVFAVFHLGGAMGSLAIGYANALGRGYAPGLWIAAAATLAAAGLFAALPRSASAVRQTIPA